MNAIVCRMVMEAGMCPVGTPMRYAYTDDIGSGVSIEQLEHFAALVAQECAREAVSSAMYGTGEIVGALERRFPMPKGATR